MTSECSEEEVREHFRRRERWRFVEEGLDFREVAKHSVKESERRPGLVSRLRSCRHCIQSLAPQGGRHPFSWRGVLGELALARLRRSCSSSL